MDWELWKSDCGRLQSSAKSYSSASEGVRRLDTSAYINISTFTKRVLQTVARPEERAFQPSYNKSETWAYMESK